MVTRGGLACPAAPTPKPCYRGALHRCASRPCTERSPHCARRCHICTRTGARRRRRTRSFARTLSGPAHSRRRPTRRSHVPGYAANMCDATHDALAMQAHNMRHATCAMQRATCIMRHATHDALAMQHHAPWPARLHSAAPAVVALLARMLYAARCRPAVEVPPAIAVPPAAVPHCERPAFAFEPFAAAARSLP